MADEPTPFDPATLDDEALRTEYSRVRDRGGELSSKDTLTAEETAELNELAARVDAVSIELSARQEAMAQVQATREKFASLPTLEPTPVPEPEPQSDVATVPETVTASAPKATVPSVATMAPSTPQVPVKEKRNDSFSISLTADGAGAIGARYGDESTVKDVARAVAKSFSQYGSAGGGQSAKRAIAQFTRDRGDDFVLQNRRAEDDDQVIRSVRKENRLEGGSLLSAWKKNIEQGASLTAAAGWCAPSENLYDLCSLWSMDGMLDVPTATARRGGFNYTNDPSYPDFETSNSFTILTEAQVIADTPKNCAELPCPTFTDARLDVAVSCITGSFLQAAGYPEWVETQVDGLLTNHAHRLNENIIARIVTFAGAANVIPAQGVATGAGAVGLSPDASVTSSVLAAVELAIVDMRYRERMSLNQTMEVVLPAWILAQFRADIGRKNAWASDNYDLTDAEIVRWFSVRGARVQFVYDWQDAFSGLATGPGGATDLLSLPTTVQFLVYPAGAVVLARQDVVTLSNVYDSTNLTQNLFTRLFAEEGFVPIFPCGEVRLYTAQACPSGATGYQAYTACAAPATGA
jgi:hypothetical protein